MQDSASQQDLQTLSSLLPFRQQLRHGLSFLLESQLSSYSTLYSVSQSFKFDLKTPGREDDDDDETKVVLANDDFTTVAKIVLDGVGGKDNVESVDNCITRLRLVIKD